MWTAVVPFAKRVIAGGAALAALGTLAWAAPGAGAAGLSSLATPSLRSPIASERFAFVMTDRYRDGNPANNAAGLAGGRERTGFDPESMAYFHGGDFAGLTGACDVNDPADDGLARLKRLGFTAVWITPPVANRVVQGDSAGYHGYWFLDATRPDPHLGTEQEFAALMSCAKRLGLKVFLDVVVNHTADTISYRGGGTGYVPIEERPYRTARGRDFDPWSFTRGRAFPSLSASRSFAYVPIAEPGFTKAPAILNRLTSYHNRGDIDWGSCSGRCEMDGDFAGLDDLMTEDWRIVKALADAYGSWITKYGVDGFRIDTAKHVDPFFFGRWLPLIRTAAASAGKADFTVFGEVWLTDPVQLSEQMLGRRLPSVLDFPYQDTVRKFVSAQASGGSLAALFDDDDHYTSAGTNAYGLTTFLGNHDMGRIGYFIRTDNPSLAGSELPRALLAHDLLFLTRGVPVVYAGDEVGMTGSGDGRDQRARQDMFATQVAEWRTEPRLGSGPVGAGSSFDESSPIEAHLAELSALRAAHPALATGAQITRYGDGPVFVASRIDRADRREYVVGFNGSAAPQTVAVPTSTPSSTWRGLLRAAPVESDASGGLSMTLPAYGVVVLRAESQLPSPGTPTVSLRSARDAAAGGYRLTATVPGADPATVTFLMKRRDGAWTPIGSDDARPFRVFLNPERTGRNAVVDIAAVVTATDGSTAESARQRLKLAPLW